MSEGIYAWLGVSPVDVKSHRAFFDQFQDRELKDNLAEGNLHVTTLFPSELARIGLADWEVPKVRIAAREILHQVSKLDLIGTEFTIDFEKVVQGRKKWWTLGIDGANCDPFDDARQESAWVIADIFNARLAEYSTEGYHISLTRKANAGHDKLRTKKLPPKKWVINSVGIEVRTVSPDIPHNNSYLNNPLRTR